MSNFIRAAVVFAVVCCASSLAADSYHPNLTSSKVVTLDASAIAAYAERGTPFDLDLGYATFNVALTPAPVWPKEGLTIIQTAKDGSLTEHHLVQDNITYAGEILGEDPATTEVRITIAGGSVEGYVLSSSDWLFIEPLSRFDAKAGPQQHLVYSTRNVDVADYPDADVKADQVIDYDRVFADPYIPLLWVADKEYVDQSGPGFEWIDRQAVLLNDINGVFKPQTGREFISRRGVVDLGGSFLTSTAHKDLLWEMVHLIEAAGGLTSEFDSDVAHLTSGKDLDGNVIGAAWRRDRYGLSQQSATLRYRNLVLAARSLGINYNADPDQADRWCAVPSQFYCLFWRQTIEYRVFNAGTVPAFSDGSRNPNHNNVALICAEMAARGFPCQP